MTTAQYRIFGFVFVLLALALGITYFGMSEGAANGTGSDPPPFWVGPGAILCLLNAIRLFRKRSPDPAGMNDVELIKYNFAQTRLTQYFLIGVFGPMCVLMVGFGFLGWDSTFEPGPVAGAVLAVVFTGCAYMVWFCLKNIYNTIGGRGAALLDRLLMRPEEIAHLTHTVTTANNIQASAQGSVHIHFSDGTSHLFQGAPDHVARIVECLLERRPDLPVNPHL